MAGARQVAGVVRGLDVGDKERHQGQQGSQTLPPVRHL
jgi:hypothetical protein